MIGNTVNRVGELIDPASEYIVVTPAGVMMVRGTTFKLQVGADGYTEVFCEEGEVEFTAAGVTVKVKEGGRPALCQERSLLNHQPLCQHLRQCQCQHQRSRFLWISSQLAAGIR